MAKDTRNIYEKLLEFQGKGLAFEKTANNPFFKSKYTPLDDLNSKIKPVLTELGLFIFHSVLSGQVTTTIVNATTPSETIECIMPIPEGITDPQKMGSAITYFKRYNTVALLNLDSETDGDGNNTKPTKKKFDKVAEKGFKVALLAGKYELPETVEELYSDLEQKYILSKDDKEKFKHLYEEGDSVNKAEQEASA